MLVEISDKTLDRLTKWAELEKACDVTSIEQWNDVKMKAMFTCTSLSHDIGLQQISSEISAPEIIPGTIDALNSITIGNKEEQQ